MFSRVVALSSIIAVASVAQGGVQVQLVPTPNLPQYPPNSVVQVDVKLAQTPGGADQRIRMIEFDMQNTSSFLTITLPLTHDRGTPGTGDDINFWSFNSLSACSGQASFCGFNHYVDDDRPAGTVDTRANVLSIAYFGLTSDAQAQILLPASGAPVTVGKLVATMPPTPGTFSLHMVNPADAGLDRGARVDFGFDPHIIWRDRAISPDPVAQVTGGSLAFTVCSSDPCPVLGSCCVSGNCSVTLQENCAGIWNAGGTCDPNPCPSECVNLVSSVPPFTGFGISTVPAGGTLWRSARNTIRLTFDEALGAAPMAGQIVIQELLPNGDFGPDVSANGFTFVLESGNTVLKVRDNDTVSDLLHRKWYAIRNTGGWTGVCNFEAQFPVQVGDATGDNRVIGADVLTVNSAVACLSNCGDQNRNDIDGNGLVVGADVLQANTSVSSFPVPKPTGH